MSRAPFVFPILDLRHERAEPRAVEVVAAVDWRVDLSRVLRDPALHARVELAPMPGGVLVRGSVTAMVRHSCHRCLDEWDEALDIAVAQWYATEGDEGTDYVVDWPEIDLGPMIRDEVLLSLHLAPVCKHGCRGVVDGTESDLNTPTPDDLGDPVSPFAVLKDLLDAGD